MPKKTPVKVKAGKVTAPKGPAKPTPAEKLSGNFLIVRTPREVRRGQTLTVLEVTETADKARKWVDKLTDSAPAFLAIVERKVLLERKPQMVVNEITD